MELDLAVSQVDRKDAPDHTVSLEEPNKGIWHGLASV